MPVTVTENNLPSPSSCVPAMPQLMFICMSNERVRYNNTAGQRNLHFDKNFKLQTLIRQEIDPVWKATR
jgi:hypothetical protein